VGPTALFLDILKRKNSHVIVEIRTQTILPQTSQYTDYAILIPHEEEEKEEEDVQFDINFSI
jgi:hypothetical protein